MNATNEVQKNQSSQGLTGQTQEKGECGTVPGLENDRNNRMTSIMAQIKACLIKWRKLQAFKMQSPLQDLSCEFKKDIFHATAGETGAELDSPQNQHHP